MPHISFVTICFVIICFVTMSDVAIPFVTEPKMKGNLFAYLNFVDLLISALKVIDVSHRSLVSVFIIRAIEFLIYRQTTY